MQAMKKTDLKYYDSWIHRHDGTSNSCKFKIYSYQPLEIELKVKWEVSANWTLSKKIHSRGAMHTTFLQYSSVRCTTRRKR